ncbi:MAG: DUF2723 domain-containing protein [Chloroflexota bacterium]
MIGITILVGLAGLCLGAALTQALAVSHIQFYHASNLPATLLASLGVAAIVWFSWQQFSRHIARRANQPLTRLLGRDGLCHLPLLLLSPFCLNLILKAAAAPLPGVCPPLARWHTDAVLIWSLLGGALILWITLRVRLLTRLGCLSQHWLNRLLAVGMLALPLLLYLRTLTPGVGAKDGFELQVVSATLGIAHPTGYPLFTLLGRSFIALVPLGSPAYRINLMCALLAALSIPVIYAIGSRILKSRAPAALAAILFAFIPTLWTQASIPEKYTLNVFFVAVVMYLAVRWAQATGPEKTCWFYRLAFAYGLSLTHHRTMLLLLPGLALWVLLTEPRLARQPRQLLIALGWFAAPLLLYLYIPWRAYAQGWRMSLPEFFTHISGSAYAPALRLDEWLTSPERRATYLRFLHDQFGATGIGLGIIGWLALLRRRWRVALFFLVTWAVYVIFGIGYHAYYNDVNYFLPAHLVFALWIAAGLQAIADGLNSLLRRAGRASRRLPATKTALWTLAALLPLSLIWTHLPQVDQSRAYNDLPWAEHVLSLDLPPGATILADSVKVAPLHYLTTVERIRPDIHVVVLPDEPSFIKALEAHLVQGLPIYLARYLPNLGGAYHLRSLGPLVEVSLNPLTQPPALARPLDTTFEHGIRLLGHDAATLSASRQSVLHVTLYWQPDEPVAESYQPRLRLVDAAGRIWWEEQGHLPVQDHYPTNAWRPGEIIADYHTIPIDDTLQPGEYHLLAGLFRPFAQTGLTLSDRSTDLALLGTVTVTHDWADAPPRPAIVRHDQLIPGLTLLGLDAPRQVRPGSLARLRLYWQVSKPLPSLEPILMVWQPCRQRAYPFSHGQAAWPDRYSTADWPPGTMVITEHAIEMTPSLAGETIRLTLESEHWQPVALTDLNVLAVPLPGQGAAFNLGNQMLLLHHDISQQALRPGEALEMSLTWQALNDMDEDYTIFVHLLGPDGLSHGQVDVWPHDGTFPTSAWPVGEVIIDRYRVPLEADAPPGDYQIEVGVYLLRTMARLPLLDDQGRAIDDKLLIGGIAVGQE